MLIAYFAYLNRGGKLETQEFASWKHVVDFERRKKICIFYVVRA